MSSKRQKKLEPEDAFGRAVRVFRKRRGLSQEALGFEADIHRTFVSDIERGTRNPTVRTIWRLAGALGVKPSDLIKLAEENLPAEKTPIRAP